MAPILESTHSISAKPVRQRYTRYRKLALSIPLLAIFLAMPWFAPVIAPFPPELQVISERLQSPNLVHLMGTDVLGRDVLSRAIYASQVSVPMGVLAMVTAVIVGLALGMVSGYVGGWTDVVIMRLTDTLLSFPQLLLIITLTTVFGKTPAGFVLALGLTSWGLNTRVVRAQVLSVKQREFVVASRALGNTHSGILFWHFLPYVLPIVIVEATMRVSWIILLEGSLSYLGLGIQPPDPTWGNMIAEGGILLRRAWWVGFFPGIFLFMCSLSFSLVGEALRDIFFPSSA